ncbi:macrophage mannose receptor 1-like isoform X2 [Cebidichthys violaceus]|uniref:macrophage mannose receptor 1-like isoform X2 n=1 Tax=Cebidichthys violaceus TaxID=271503 RepID=UPI0035CBE3C8
MCESSSVREERHQREASKRKTHKIANMQWTLFVLILMGQCSFCLCRLYEYHLVKENKSWEEAQTYCRERYTDLAKVFDMTDMKRLNDSASHQGEAWIGLHKQTNVNRTWLWSLPEVKFNDSETEWKDGEPNDYGNNPENCVRIVNHKWLDVLCSRRFLFICYDEKNQKKFHLINKEKTWLEAQSYCREHHTDLVSGLTQLNDEEFKTETEPESNREVWIGLFRDTWRWSDESSFSFRFWDPDQFQDEDDKKCAMTVSNGKWSSDECTWDLGCDTTMTDQVILINESKTWEQALTYCRKNHRDLISITDPQKQRWAEEVGKQANTPYVWTGLLSSCTEGLWFWVTDEIVCYSNWSPYRERDTCGNNGVMETGGEHNWFKKNGSMEFNFICTKR